MLVFWSAPARGSFYRFIVSSSKQGIYWSFASQKAGKKRFGDDPEYKAYIQSVFPPQCLKWRELLMTLSLEMFRYSGRGVLRTNGIRLELWTRRMGKSDMFLYVVLFLFPFLCHQWDSGRLFAIFSNYLQHVGSYERFPKESKTSWGAKGIF